MNTKTDFLKTLKLLVVIVAILSIVLVLLLVHSHLSVTPRWLWLGSIILFMLIISFLGTWVGTSTKGFLIDEQNRLSLARLQMTLWFVLLITTTASVAIARYTANGKTVDWEKVRTHCEKRYAGDTEKQSHCGDPINWLIIIIPEELLLAAGLSVATSVAKAFVNSAKRTPRAQSEYFLNQEHDRLVREYEGQKRALAHVAEPVVKGHPDKVNVYKLRTLGQPINDTGRQLQVFRNRSGQLRANQKPTDAQIRNLVSGNEVWNFDNLDLTKLQALVITGLLLSLYGLAIWRFLAMPGDLYNPVAATLPSFSGSLLTLLTISLAGYVGVQAADHASPQVEVQQQEWQALASSREAHPQMTQMAKISSKWSTGEVKVSPDDITLVLTADGTSYRLKRRDDLKDSPSINWPPNSGAQIYFQEPNDDSPIDTIITEQGQVITA